MQTSLGFIGLGVMGYEMAGHLAKTYPLRVYNRSVDKALRWCEQFGGTIARSPAELAQGTEILFTCVGNDADLEAVAYGAEGLFAGGFRGIWVDHTTASLAVTQALAAALSERGGAFLDAPVSGGQSGAQAGKLAVMVGGDETAFARVVPFVETYAKLVRRMGEVGSGQLTKMVNQICIAGLLQGLAEGLHFAEVADLDVEAVIEVISQGAAQSWQLENRGHTMTKRSFDFGFAVDWMRKDLGIVLTEARKQGVSLPVTALVDQFYGEIQQRGGARWDTSSLIRRFDR